MIESEDINEDSIDAGCTSVHGVECGEAALSSVSSFLLLVTSDEDYSSRVAFCLLGLEDV